MTTIGYQLRLPRDEASATWSPERRAKYLLVPDIDAPLSADVDVWPVASENEIGEELFADYVSGEYEAANGLGVFQLRSGSNSGALGLAASKLNVVGISADQADADRLMSKYLISRNSIATPSDIALKLLGFDVCDDALISGLMNCGVGVFQRNDLVKRFKIFINEYGLFDRFDIAQDFAGVIDGLVPEHAPFIPIGLFVLGSLS